MRKEPACDNATYNNCRFCNDQCLGGLIEMIRYDTMADDVSLESMICAQQAISDFQSIINEQVD